MHHRWSRGGEVSTTHMLELEKYRLGPIGAEIDP